MNKLTEFIKTRSIGFYLTVVAALGSLIAIIIYPALFRNMFWDVWALFFLIIGLVLAIVFVIAGFYKKGLENWAPALIGAGAFLSLLFFLLVSYEIFVRKFGGFESIDFPAGYVFLLVLFGIIILLSIVSIFLKQKKNDNS